MTIYVSIGNSDDRLTQADWCEFYHQVADAIVMSARTLHGRWVSPATDPWQNAAWCFEIDEDLRDVLRHRLGRLARTYRQDSIAWAVADTEFLPGAES